MADSAEPWWARMTTSSTAKAHLVERRGNGWHAVCGKHTLDQPTPVPETVDQCARCFRMADGTWQAHTSYPTGFGRAPAVQR